MTTKPPTPATPTTGDSSLAAKDDAAASPPRPVVDEGTWRPIESAPKDGTLFLAWQTIPTLDEDSRCTTREGSPCIAQTVFGSVASIPIHYVPQGQRITHWAPLPAPPTTGAEPGMAMPLGASQSKENNDEKVRQLARLGAAMGRLCR